MQAGNPSFHYLTISLDLSGRRAVLVGGGAVAARKARVLRDAGMVLELIAPELVRPLASLAEAGELLWHRRCWQPADLHGAALAVAATSDREVNRQVALEAKRLGIPVNVADCGEEGTFRFPALLRRGSLEVAVGTGGRSPAAATAIRDRLSELFGEEYGVALELLAELREKLLTVGMPEAYNANLVKRLMAQGLMELLAEGRRADAETLINTTLLSDS